MTLALNFIDNANLITDDNGNLITSQFTSSEMIEEIKTINEYYKQEYETDEDLIKIIDYEKEFIEECMIDFDNNKELQKIFNYDREAYREYSEKLFNKFYEDEMFNYNNLNSEIKVDSDNNFKEEEHPRDEDGKFAKGTQSEKESEESKKEENNNEDVSKEEKQKEIEEKIEKLKEIDWTKDNTLPNFPKSFLDEYGLEDKPVLLKKNIIDRNFYEKHKDVDKEKAIKILGNALYKTDEIFHGREDRPNYYNFIYYTDDGHSDLVLVEIEDKKENYEIVDFYRMNKRGQRKLEKRTNKLEKKS